MTDPDHISLAGYKISERYFAHLAGEFYATVQFPAGDHAVAHLTFDPPKHMTAEKLRYGLLSALECFKKPAK